jgi:acetyltransferase-like isoleucine patch superfamily enzyme
MTRLGVQLLERVASRVRRAFDDVKPVRWTSQRTLPGQTPPPTRAFARFGSGSWIVPSVIIRNPHRIAVGNRVVVLENGVLCVLDDGPPGARLTVGDGVRLARFNTIVCEVGVTLGAGVASSDSVAILDTWALPHAATIPTARVLPPPPAPVAIGAGAYLACNSTVLPGVTIGEGAYVGEGAVVVDDVPPHSVVRGNPARVVRRYDSDAARWHEVGGP